MPEIKVKIVADGSDAQRELDQVEAKGKGLSGRLGGAFGAMGKALVAGLAAAGTAIGAVAAQAFDAYGEFEQLAGGVDKLFGDAADTVIANSERAFQTAGMSQAQYMQNATMLSASLISSLGGDTEAAAAQVDVAMRAIADNADTFGTSVEDVANVYQALARGQFQTLDNLRLGYAGTKTGMEELIADANRIREANGEAADLSIDSFSDMVTAIETVQEAQNIAGTTANEAATTIQGATRMAANAWQDLLTHLADPDADIDALVTQFTDSLETLATVAAPVIEQMAQSFGTALPIIVPQLLELAAGIVTTLMETVLEQAPMLVEAFVGALQLVVDALPGMLPMLVTAAVTLFLGLLDGLTQATPAILDGLTVALTTLIDQLPVLLPALLSAAVTFFMAIATAIVRDGPAILSALRAAINSLLQMVANSGTQMLVAFGNLMERGRAGIAEKVPQVVEAVKGAIRSAIDGVVGMAGEFVQAGKNLIAGIASGISSGAGAVVEAAKSAARAALDAAKSFLGIHSPSTVFRDQVGLQMVEGAIEGLERGASLYDRAVERTFGIDLTSGMASPDYGGSAVGGVVAWLESRLGPTIERYAGGGDTYVLPEGVYADAQVAQALDMLSAALVTARR